MFNSPNPSLRSKSVNLRNNCSTMEYGNNSIKENGRKFAAWYQHMIDNDKKNLILYLSDDSTLEWFGRTIKTRKKVGSFIKYNIECTRHDFRTILNIDKINSREGNSKIEVDTVLASPLSSPELIPTKKDTSNRKRSLRSLCVSPEWAEGCKPPEEGESGRKKMRKRLNYIEEDIQNTSEINNRGDGVSEAKKCLEYLSMTPTNQELGQGDCLPSTSTDSNKSHDTLYSQLPKLAVECSGYIEFNRARNSNSIDGVKWERKCKVQISYSVDPLNVGEYIIWAIRYTDESKCRRNLLAAFEEVAREAETKKAL